MEVQKTTEPYELLVRWRNGVLAGAHVQFITVLREGEVVLHETVGEALPVSLGSGEGFPVAQILSPMQAAAIARAEEAIAAHSASLLEIERMRSDHESQMTRAHEALAACEQRCAALAADIETTRKAATHPPGLTPRLLDQP